VLSLAPHLAAAGGPVHGGKAAGMGTAFVGLADDPSAILHNPGGLAQLQGTQWYAGVTAVVPSSEYRSPAGESEQTEFQVFFPPHLFVSTDGGSRDLVFGLGIYSPFGVGGRQWPEDGATRHVSVESFIATVSLNPTIAWKVRPGISVAAGIDYLRALNRAENRIDQSLFGAADARMKLEADGDGWGYNLGALIRLGDTLRLGLAYRSRIKVDFKGDIRIKRIAPALQPLFGAASFRTDIKTHSDFPEIYSIGIAWFPNERLVIDMDHEWVQWSSFKRQDLDLEDEVPAAGVADTSTPLDWKNSQQFKLGLDYRVSPTLSLRAGYAFINNPVPASTLSPANPDADQHNFSLGLGYRKNAWVVDVFYDVALYEQRTVNNAILSGTYKNRVHYVGLSVGYRR